jgi:hypothetical protein
VDDKEDDNREDCRCFPKRRRTFLWNGDVKIWVDLSERGVSLSRNRRG